MKRFAKGGDDGSDNEEGNETNPIAGVLEGCSQRIPRRYKEPVSGDAAEDYGKETWTQTTEPGGGHYCREVRDKRERIAEPRIEQQTRQLLRLLQIRLQSDRRRAVCDSREIAPKRT